VKILLSDQIKTADSFTIMQKGISSADLMELAAGKCYEWITNRYGLKQSYLIFCGPGNNGGDGLVIARMLHMAGAAVEVVLSPASQRTIENSLNLERLVDLEIKIISSQSVTFRDNLIKDNFIIIDALLGNGFRFPPDKEMEDLISVVNTWKKHAQAVVSIDCPSGFYTDGPMPDNPVAVKADFTLCFHCPRLMYFFSESEPFTGTWEVIDIGLLVPPDIETTSHYLLEKELKQLLQARKTFSHKGSYGHALIAGGSEGHCGAIIMAAKACLRSGAGLVSALMPPACILSFQAACMEAMTISSGESGYTSPVRIEAERYSVIAFGPGTGTHENTCKLLKYLIQEARGPMVIDADGINILSENRTWLAFIPFGSILTPHPREFDRLTGKSSSSYERFEKAKELSTRHKLIIVLKDAFTRIILPDGRVYFNSTGNPGMATAGSGDVLTGIICGLLAQGLSPEHAAKLGVFIHGVAGDLAMEMYSQPGMTAGDIIQCLPAAWKHFQD
jgi:ADP-dependent NAD(P)H-hydrate dehydratase / NAD(P)H-hydrate epimerase